MITYHDGDILESGADVICQQVNCKGVMGAGLAKQIRNKYPKVYTEYKKRCECSSEISELLGHAQFISVGETVVVNCFGQDGYGRDREKVYTYYPALARSFQEVFKRYFGTQKTIAIPYGIGCGLAGGNWNTVIDTIEFVFEGYDGEVQIWRI